MIAPVDGDAGPETDGTEGFTVRLANFQGPFDLLLQLIGQHRLDVTEIALHTVTDDFIAYTRRLGTEAELEQVTGFLVVAATLLDLKAARLLPSGEVDDEEDLELLEARDLLFARVLQYRAYKRVAQLFAELEAAGLQRYPAAVGLEERFQDLLPEVRLGVGPAELAAIAAEAMRPRVAPQVDLAHLHSAKVSVPEQAARLLEILRGRGVGAAASFPELVADCGSGLEIVARFLGLLELYRQRAVTFHQPEPLGELSVSWCGEGDADTITDEEYG